MKLYVRILIFLVVSNGIHFNAVAQDALQDKIESLKEQGKKEGTNDPTKAKEIYNELLLIAKENKLESLESYSYRYLSFAEKRLGNYPASLELLFKSLKITEQQNDSINTGLNYTAIGTVLRFQKKRQEALEYYDKSIAVNKLLKDTINIAFNLEQKGVVYRRMGKPKMAIASYNEAIELNDVIGNKKGLQRIRLNLAKLLQTEGKNDEALAVYFDELPSLIKEGNERYLVSTYENIAANYEDKGLFKQAIQYRDSAILLSEKNGYLERLVVNLQQRSNYYAALGDFKNALQDQKAYKIAYDSVFNSKNAQRIAELQLEHEFGKKQFQDSLAFGSEKRLLKTEAKNQQTQKWLYVMLLGITILGLITLLLYYQNRRKLNNELIEREILEKELLNEKLAFIQHRVEQLIVDNKMRLDYKKELLQKVKTLKQQQSTTTVQEYQSLIIGLQNQINTETRLDALTKNTIITDVDFENKLYKLYPELTKSEREICSLIQMNLSLKEIMNIRNSSMASIKSSRYRIRKKMNIPKGQELELFIKKIAG